MWPVDLARRRLARQPDEIVLVALKANQQVVAACCGASLRAGVRPGMTVAHARALLRRPTLVDADPYGDRAMLDRLARWTMRFSPLVGIDTSGVEEGQEPDGILIDITGCGPVFRGEECLAGLISAGLTGLRLHHKIGIAPNIGAAWAAAHCGEDVITFAGGCHYSPQSGAGVANTPTPFSLLSSFLSPLPIGALRLPSQTRQALTELGIDHIEDLVRLPRVAVPSRFGPQALLRLDQALGRAPEEFTPIRPEPPLRLERMFEGPTTNLEAIELATRELLDLLAHELSRRESGVVSLALQFDRLKQDCRGTENVEERLRLSRPCRNPRHLWSLLRPRIERVHMGYGIEGISVVALRQRRVRHRQLLREDRKGDGQSQSVGELIDTLVNRLGEGGVLRATVRDSHTPERIAVYEPAINERSPSAHADGVASQVPLRACGGGARVFEGGGGVCAPRPSVLFDTPEGIQAVAMMPDRPPTLLRWQSQELRILAGIGPERIGGEWWRKKWPSGRVSGRVAISDTAELSLAFRDYYRVQDQIGRWLWVYRDSEAGRWFLHGMWA
jgi:protein ImuB